MVMRASGGAGAPSRCGVPMVLKRPFYFRRLLLVFGMTGLGPPPTVDLDRLPPPRHTARRRPPAAYRRPPPNLLVRKPEVERRRDEQCPCCRDDRDGQRPGRGGLD